jgi:hypothetical protein
LLQKTLSRIKKPLGPVNGVGVAAEAGMKFTTGIFKENEGWGVHKYN